MLLQRSDSTLAFLTMLDQEVTFFLVVAFGSFCSLVEYNNVEVNAGRIIRVGWLVGYILLIESNSISRGTDWKRVVSMRMYWRRIDLNIR